MYTEKRGILTQQEERKGKLGIRMRRYPCDTQASRQQDSKHGTQPYPHEPDERDSSLPNNMDVCMCVFMESGEREEEGKNYEMLIKECIIIITEYK